MRRQDQAAYGWASGAILLMCVALFFVAHFVAQPATVTSSRQGGGRIGSGDQGTSLSLTDGVPAHGQAVDRLSCYLKEGTVEHFHITLRFYADGKQGLAPPGIGIVAPQDSGTQALGFDGTSHCIYPLHVHVADNLIHVESFSLTTYTLGQLFDLWGQPLSRTQVAGYQSGPGHPLSFAVLDHIGHLKTYVDDPRAMPLIDGETIVILYNTSSFKVTR